MKSTLEEVIRTESKRNEIDPDLMLEIIDIHIKNDSSDVNEKRVRQKSLRELLEEQLAEGSEV